jgi:hypothetical protein
MQGKAGHVVPKKGWHVRAMLCTAPPRQVQAGQDPSCTHLLGACPKTASFHMLMRPFMMPAMRQGLS